MSLHLSVFDYLICGYYNVQITTAVQSYRHLICRLSILRRFAHCLCPHKYFSCSHHKQLNGNFKGKTFMILAANEQAALMSSSYSKTCLLLYVHKHFAPCHLFVFHYKYIYLHTYIIYYISYYILYYVLYIAYYILYILYYI